MRPPARRAAACEFAVAVAIASAFASAGCLGPGAFRCSEKSQCGEDGFCESTGACSFADRSGACRSGRRYGTHAPDALSGACVLDACSSNPVVALHGGGGHACLVRQNGDVSCWGAGTDGQLGDGQMLSRSKPTTIPRATLGDALDVAAGGRHTCALLKDSSVWCWGANEDGQLGDGSTSPRATPVAVVDTAGAPLTNIGEIAAGGAFTCAARLSGEVFCWGRNQDGELGSGTTTGGPLAGGLSASSATPQRAALPATVEKLSARDRHACAVTRDGGVWCWGANEQGELGDGSQVSRATPVPVTTLADHTIEEIAAGAAHTCAMGEGMLWCWGTNELGELGDGSNQDRLTPTLVPLLRPIDLTAAGHHTCAREEDGTLWCWGGNQAGQLGEGTTSNFGVPVPVTGVEDAAALASGDTFSCALRREGTVWCWGDNRLGQLGTGAPIERLEPPREGAPGRGSVTLSIAAGGAHTCTVHAVTSSGAGETTCWGANQAGQLGDGTRLDRSAAVSLKIMLDARQIAGGALHTCLRAADGGVWCWGRGGAGQLGTPALIDVAVPTSVAGASGAIGLAAGGSHTCAVRGDQSAWCWGANAEGQLGDGTSVGRSRPARATAAGGGGVVEVAAGAAHTCARHGNGTVSCWGRGDEGQLGDGMARTTSVAVTATDLNGATAIATGADHSCALLTDQTVRCWGAGAAGQLGWGARTSHAVPSKVMNLNGVVQLAAGANHTCARTAPDGRIETAGNLYCWGANDSGQLGNGSHAPDLAASPSPDAPVLNGDVLGIAAGAAHTCAMKKDRSIVCWGSNSAGQLGDATPLQLPTAQPARVSCP